MNLPLQWQVYFRSSHTTIFTYQFQMYDFLSGSSNASITNFRCEVVAFGLRELGGEEWDN